MLRSQIHTDSSKREQIIIIKKKTKNNEISYTHTDTEIWVTCINIVHLYIKDQNTVTRAQCARNRKEESVGGNERKT